MPIFHKHRLIFTHLPKTGGRAINAWLGGIDGFDGHVSLNHVNNIINPLSLFKVANIQDVKKRK